MNGRSDHGIDGFARTDPFPQSCEGVKLRGRLWIPSILPGFIFLLIAVLPAQAQNIFQMSQKERAAYFVKINEESYRDWTRMIDLLHIEIPKSLQPPVEDPNRPKNTFQKAGSGASRLLSGVYFHRLKISGYNGDEHSLAKKMVLIIIVNGKTLQQGDNSLPGHLCHGRNHT